LGEILQIGLMVQEAVVSTVEGLRLQYVDWESGTSKGLINSF